MTKPIPRALHGVADFGYIPAVAAAPALAGFAGDRTATTLARGFAGAVFLSTFFTRAEWGAVKVMPYRTHLALDLGAGLLAFAAPWMFGFAHNKPARNTFLAMGAAGVLAYALSEPEEMPIDAVRHAERGLHLENADRAAAPIRKRTVQSVSDGSPPTDRVVHSHTQP